MEIKEDIIQYINNPSKSRMVKKGPLNFHTVRLNDTS